MDEQDIEQQDERSPWERRKDELWEQEEDRRWQRLATSEGIRDLQQRVIELRRDLDVLLRAFQQAELDAIVLKDTHQQSMITNALRSGYWALGRIGMLPEMDAGSVVAAFSRTLDLALKERFRDAFPYEGEHERSAAVRDRQMSALDALPFC